LTNLLKKEGTSQKPYPDTLKVLNELKEGYVLGLITNTYYYAYKQLNERFKIDCLFDVVLKSYEIGILKPDPKIFEIMLRKLKVKSDEALMIGDSLEDDVKAAENFGIKGILIDRKNKYPSYKNRIVSLEELKKFL
jgi:putative hydrolase of the HAD superfamily